MPLKIRPATDADGPPIGFIGREAFRDSLSKSLFPPHLHAKSKTGDVRLDEVQWRATRAVRRMNEGKPTFVVVDVPEDKTSAEVVVGFAQWELPFQPASSNSIVGEADKDPVPATLDTQVFQEMYDIMDIETNKALGPDGHSKMWCKFAPVFISSNESF